MTITTTRDGEDSFDVVVIGSGFGGSMAAHVLVHAGQRVLMIERGDWVRRGPHNWAPENVCEATPCYCHETPYHVNPGAEGETIGAYYCVGGPSVFYGAVALRMRLRDFEPDPSIVTDTNARWPYNYSELEPQYTEAEALLGVAGQAGEDPTEPYRSAPYPQTPAALSNTSRRIGRAARALGFRPFRLPLAINYSSSAEQGACIACRTCDCFACGISAKNDLATRVIPRLIAQGLTLATNTVALRLITNEHEDWNHVNAKPLITALECLDKTTGARRRYRAKRFVVAAGAIASPHLILASGLERLNPAGQAIGHYLMRHCNAMVFGLFPGNPDPHHQFHKQLGITDYYFGHPSVLEPRGKLGSLQQVHTPAVKLVEARVSAMARPFMAPMVEHLTGLLAIAEDQPRYENYIALDRSQTDEVGLPRLYIEHSYTSRDLAARAALVRAARRILRRAGAWFFYVHDITTFSHAVGTIRMGSDRATSPLDENCRYRGIDNLFVMDGSCLPTSAGVNPSLTIAAVSLRAARRLALEVTRPSPSLVLAANPER
ncbi:MAG: GMC oxidoreductase [Gemmatimonadaceae bacterium]